MCRVPIRVPIADAKNIPFCINCKYYIPPTTKETYFTTKRHGFCAKSGMINVVDGTIHYENVELYREYDCKGKLYEEKSDIEPMAYESMDFLSY
jgi:hypothetical protein